MDKSNYGVGIEGSMDWKESIPVDVIKYVFNKNYIFHDGMKCAQQNACLP